MATFLAILASIAGVVGVLLGVLLNEFVRRKNRRELYAPKIFEKRLAAYENLAELIQNGSKVANEVIENPDLTTEQRHDVIGAVVVSIAKSMDKDLLYIDKELGAYCAALCRERGREAKITKKLLWHENGGPPNDQRGLWSG
jgi:hypothetical protein